MKLVCLILLMLSPLSAEAADGASPSTNAMPAWKLLIEVKADSTGVFLDQVAVQSNSNTVPHVRVINTPAFGQINSISRARISEFVRTNFPELASTNWSGPAQIRVSRRTRQLNDSDVIKLLTDTLQRDVVKNRGELELQLSRPGPPLIVPDEAVALKTTELPVGGVTPTFMVRYELFCGTERVGVGQAAVQAIIWHDVAVAQAPLARGQQLHETDFTLERRDVLANRDFWMNFTSMEVALEMTENIAAGMPLLTRSVRLKPVIQRGKVVEAIYRDGSLSISLKVEALEDGLPGQVVRLRNPKTRRELYGKVQNEQSVLINL